YQLAKFLPVKFSALRKWMGNALRQINGIQEAAAVWWQWLLATGIGRANIFAEPVVIPIVYPVNQDKPRLGKIVSGTHNLIPQLPGGNFFVNLAGHFSLFVAQVITI